MAYLGVIFFANIGGGGGQNYFHIDFCCFGGLRKEGGVRAGGQGVVFFC